MAFVNASTLVLASSNVTTASAFSRLMSALLTPCTLVNDLFTEIAQEPQVIPDTASVTVLVAVHPQAEYAIATAITARAMKFFIFLRQNRTLALLRSSPASSLPTIPTGCHRPGDACYTPRRPSPQPASALSRTTSHGATFQNTSRAKALRPNAKSAGRTMALVQTGL